MVLLPSFQQPQSYSFVLVVRLLTSDSEVTIPWTKLFQLLQGCIFHYFYAVNISCYYTYKLFNFTKLYLHHLGVTPHKKQNNRVWHI
jgi:hypothetical protein